MEHEELYVIVRLKGTIIASLLQQLLSNYFSLQILSFDSVKMSYKDYCRTYGHQFELVHIKCE